MRIVFDFGSSCQRNFANQARATAQHAILVTTICGNRQANAFFPPRSGFVQQIAAGNAGWPFQFRFAVHVIWSRVPEFWTLGKLTMSRLKVILIVGAGLAIAVLGVCLLCRVVQQDRWVQESIKQLHQKGAPPASLANTLPEGVWAKDEYLLFTNGWALFTSHTFHESLLLGDVAVLVASDGSTYLSHYHFCITDGQYRFRPRPRDIGEFIEIYGRFQSWKKISGAQPGAAGNSRCPYRLRMIYDYRLSFFLSTASLGGCA